MYIKVTKNVNYKYKLSTKVSNKSWECTEYKHVYIENLSSAMQNDHFLKNVVIDCQKD